ncbi:hypothetical protein BRE01_14550 [Brevibacillus reuszeri]|uniref:AraC-type arabinose-binding/dimerisation domain-containing protein n=1 Tax=Brevibacillus reuszeri TaxID=54915 RepID=A0ABQ0TIN1_9BACL|nr:AraC family ligand binding domain-containing protein [Brevibacillus reuszeri]MED1856548.1 AraC family ligand binding domain-containing protein [Brevibacillus reuszeri]GED67753.1 hypothetical protein BRE01_14550 [Brevibacillus reuszeri]
MFVVAHGKAEVTIGLYTYQVKPGTILFINPEQPIKVTAASNESLHSYLITFDILTKREQTDTPIIYDARKTEWLVDGKLTTDYSQTTELIGGSLCSWIDGRNGFYCVSAFASVVAEASVFSMASLSMMITVPVSGSH